VGLAPARIVRRATHQGRRWGQEDRIGTIVREQALPAFLRVSNGDEVLENLLLVHVVAPIDEDERAVVEEPVRDIPAPLILGEHARVGINLL